MVSLVALSSLSNTVLDNKFVVQPVSTRICTGTRPTFPGKNQVDLWGLSSNFTSGFSPSGCSSLVSFSFFRALLLVLLGGGVPESGFCSSPVWSCSGESSSLSIPNRLLTGVGLTGGAITAGFVFLGSVHPPVAWISGPALLGPTVRAATAGLLCFPVAAVGLGIWF